MNRRRLRSTALVVFAKAPRPGRVKTRLTPPFTPNRAAFMHKAMLHAVLLRTGALPFAAHLLAVSPDEMCADFTEHYPHIDLVLPQGDGDLGQRLIRVLADVFDRYRRPMIVLGSDSPDLPLDRLVAAADAAAEGAAAICPSHDGGYCLIATPRPEPRLFAAVDWGTGLVASQTRAAAKAAGLPLRELPAWEDVDTPGDLDRLADRLACAEEAALADLHRAIVSAKLPPAPDMD